MLQIQNNKAQKKQKNSRQFQIYSLRKLRTHLFCSNHENFKKNKMTNFYHYIFDSDHPGSETMQIQFLLADERLGEIKLKVEMG